MWGPDGVRGSLPGCHPLRAPGRQDVSRCVNSHDILHHLQGSVAQTQVPVASSGPPCPLCRGRDNAVVTAVRSWAGAQVCCFLCLLDVNFIFMLKGRGNGVLFVFQGVGFPGMSLGFRAHPPGLNFRWAGAMAAPVLAQGHRGYACPGAAVTRTTRWGA